jgi:hypothetical protein
LCKHTTSTARQTWTILTNKVLLPRAHLQAHKPHDTRDNRQRTQRERQRNTARAPEHTPREQYGRNGVYNKVAGEVEGEVEDEGLGGVEHGARAVLLAPLDGHIGAAEEGVVKQDGQVASHHEAGHAEEHLAQPWVGGEVEVGPVEGEHAEFGEAHADVVEVV